MREREREREEGGERKREKQGDRKREKATVYTRASALAFTWTCFYRVFQSYADLAKFKFRRICFKVVILINIFSELFMYIQFITKNCRFQLLQNIYIRKYNKEILTLTYRKNLLP